MKLVKITDKCVDFLEMCGSLFLDKHQTNKFSLSAVSGKKFVTASGAVSSLGSFEQGVFCF